MTRIEVLDFVGELFGTLPVSRAAMLRTARTVGGRPELLEVLERLPGTSFREVPELWRHLDVPEDLAAARRGPDPPSDGGSLR